jgi:hypothetical protein
MLAAYGIPATSEVFAKINRNIQHRISFGRAEVDAADTFWAPQAVQRSAPLRLRCVREIAAKLLARRHRNARHVNRSGKRLGRRRFRRD